MTSSKLILICLACSLVTVAIASLVVAGAADDVIKRVYRFPFTDYSPRFLLKNNSSLRYSDFVAQALAGLLAGGCIFEHCASRFCVKPLTVAGGRAEVAFIHRSQSRNK